VVGLPLANASGDPSDGKTEVKLNRERVEDTCGQPGTDWSRGVPRTGSGKILGLG